MRRSRTKRIQRVQVVGVPLASLAVFLFAGCVTWDRPDSNWVSRLDQARLTVMEVKNYQQRNRLLLVYQERLEARARLVPEVKQADVVIWDASEPQYENCANEASILLVAECGGAVGEKAVDANAVGFRIVKTLQEEFAVHGLSVAVARMPFQENMAVIARGCVTWQAVTQSHASFSPSPSTRP